MANTIIKGFSLTNRWLIYTNLMFTPAHTITGYATKLPVNIGFYAFNAYQQYLWYTGAKSNDLHALSFLPIYFNLVYAFTYLGGATSRSKIVGTLAALATMGLILMNIITAWICIKSNLPAGDGVYEFFFFGWKKLNKTWRVFFLLWEISDTVVSISTLLCSVWTGVLFSMTSNDEVTKSKTFRVLRDTSVIWGSALSLLVLIWPLIMWMELIVQRNKIVSETDMISVYLFIAQVALMMIPTLISLVKWPFDLGSSSGKETAEDTPDSEEEEQEGSTLTKEKVSDAERGAEPVLEKNVDDSTGADKAS